MEREVIITADGSATLKNHLADECYHSTYGAFTESMHIFINNGLNRIIDSGADSIIIFEAGFGTGLNTLLSVITADKYPSIKFEYITVEKYPITQSELEKLNYLSFAGTQYKQLWQKIHTSPWGSSTLLIPNFSLQKINMDIKELSIDRSDFNVVFFDAFSPGSQPELWTSAVFGSIKQMMTSKSVLVTYSSKGVVKEALRGVGFRVERVAGPAGKRHIIVAHLD